MLIKEQRLIWGIANINIDKVIAWYNDQYFNQWKYFIYVFEFAYGIVTFSNHDIVWFISNLMIINVTLLITKVETQN